MHSVSQYLRSRDGNFGLLAGLVMVALVWVAGLAVDFSNALRVKTTAQDIVDATVLRATRDIIEEGKTLAEAELSARKYFDAELAFSSGVGLEVSTFTLTQGVDGIVKLGVSGKTSTSLLKAVGREEIPVSVDAAAHVGGGSVEIAIAFDVTNSMGFGTTWGEATSVIASALNALKANSGSMALTFIPFTDRVNVGMGRANLLNPGDQTAVKKGGWGGCVDVRATKKKNKGETEYFMPDSAPEKGDRFTKFDNGTPAAHKSGYKLACNPQSIIGPTSNVSDVTSQLGKLTKGGTGRFDLGFAWLWYALSPNWKGFWSGGAPADNGVNLADYPTASTNTRKIAVLATDGLTNAYVYEYGKTNLAGWNTGSKDHFENVVAICKSMAAQKIEVHVMHVNGNDKAEPYFRECASATGGGYYKVASKQTLVDALTGITNGGGNLRLVN
ncbi:hypothetical protein HPDFL43_13595 [Hoeflea phototrophica DFL-43]|uniref:Putative Flp pilus-assembly TadG-like N-terminal domain-containing protein n=2 Tax=Hoeflea TaxID=274591 RepID=A9DEB0_HOEPD|nr:pilus assembly protein TadG-related protein [Hoeflea phototrophica]EDQ32002.2 hypothetical protein HPDFL43_13595 [Hoeflea phototrophica DFL-43]